MRIRASVIAAGVAFAVLGTSGCTATSGQVIPTAYIDDTVITSTIRARHAQNQDAAITGISVETLYGVVLLTGFAQSPQEKLAAQIIASEVAGVKAIHNEIVIQTDVTARDTAPSDRAAPVLQL